MLMLISVIIIIKSCKSIIAQVQSQSAATLVPSCGCRSQYTNACLRLNHSRFCELEAQLKPDEYSSIKFHWKFSFRVICTEMKKKITFAFCCSYFYLQLKGTI